MPLLPSHTLLQAYTITLIGSSFLLLLNPLWLLNSTPLWLLGESMHIRRASFVPPTPDLGNTPSTYAPGVTLQGKRSIAESLLGGTVLLSDDLREVLGLLGLVLFFAAVTQGILVTPLYYSKHTLSDLAQRSRTSRYKDQGDRSAIAEFGEKIHTLHTAQTLFLTLSALRVVLQGALVAYIYLCYSDRSHKLGAEIRITSKNEEGVIGLLANRIVFALAMADMLFWGYIWTVLREEARDVAEVVHLRRKLEEEDSN